MALVLAYLALLVGCSGGEPETTGVSWSALIVEIDHTSSPREIILCISGGELVTVHLDPDRDYGFDLSHLSTHMDDEEPLLVVVEQSTSPLVATQILDSASSPADC